MAGVGGQAAGADRPARLMERRRLDVIGLDGLVRATEALAGGNLDRACATLAAWQRLDRRPLDGLGAATLWALYPLGGRPVGTPTAVLAEMLDGVRTDPSTVRVALAWSRGRLAAARLDIAAPTDPLEVAARGYATATVELCRRVADALLVGAAGQAEEAVEAARPGLIDRAEQIRVLASGQPAPSTAHLPPPPVPHPPAPLPPPEGALEDTGPLRAHELAAPRPRRRPAPRRKERVWPAVAFAGFALTLAIVVLGAVLATGR